MFSSMTDPDSGPINRAATFHRPADDDGLPALGVAGVLVFVYLDPYGTLRVTVDTESPDPGVFGEGTPIPIRINVNSGTVFHGTDMHGPFRR